MGAGIGISPLVQYDYPICSRRIRSRGTTSGERGRATCGWDNEMRAFHDNQEPQAGSSAG